MISAMNDKKKNKEKETDLNKMAFNIVEEATKEKSDSKPQKPDKEKTDK